MHDNKINNIYFEAVPCFFLLLCTFAAVSPFANVVGFGIAMEEIIPHARYIKRWTMTLVTNGGESSQPCMDDDTLTTDYNHNNRHTQVREA